jgi:hypothetical protein
VDCFQKMMVNTSCTILYEGWIGCMVIPKDLKASYVLYSSDGDDSWEFLIADFKCSIGIVGTGFWRALKILQACKDRIVRYKHELFTKEAKICIVME